MAGLLFVVSESTGDAELIVRDGAPRMLHFSWLRSHQYVTNHFAAACILPDAVAPTLWQSDAAGDFAAVFGEYYPADEGVIDRNATFKEVQSLCCQGLEGRLKNRNGIYNLVFWDHRERSLVIANDSTGALLLFSANFAGGRIWCSEPGILFRLCELRWELDRDAMESLLQLGYQPDNRTLNRNVKVFPPATVKRIQLSSSGTRERTDTGDSLLYEEVKVDYDSSFSALLRDAVRIRLGGDLPIRLPLSGGEDSRLILGSALDLGINLSTFTLDGCQRGDRATAVEVAALAGVDHTIVDREHHAVADHLGFLTTALASTMEWHTGVFVTLLKKLGPDATIPLGFLGGTFSGTFISAVAGDDSRERLVQTLASAFDLDLDSEANAYNPGANGSASLKRFLKSTTSMSVRSEILWNLYRRQRKYSSFLVRLAWNFGRPVCPFADRRLARLGLSLTRSELYLQGARRRVFERQFPALARVVNGNDGLAVNSFALRRLKDRLRGTVWSALIRDLLGFHEPNYDLERLRPLLFEATQRLPDNERRLMESLSSGASLLKSFAFLPLVVCHKDSLDFERYQPAPGGRAT